MVKRVVLQHTQGSLAGLRRIVGTEYLLGTPPIALGTALTYLGVSTGFIKYTQILPRYHFFKEVAIPVSPPSTPNPDDCC